MKIEKLNHDAKHFDLSLVLMNKGQKGTVLSRLQILGNTVSHAVSRAKAEVQDPQVIVLQTSALGA